MIRHTLLTPMLALSMTLMTTNMVHAQGGYRQQSNTTLTGSLQVTFGHAPHWMDVSGTRVQEIRQEDRPDYDMFRYDNHYYAYNNNRWYMSNQQDGAFNYMDSQSVPVELQKVPREHWRTYPTDWQDRNHGDPQDRNYGDSQDRNRGDWQDRNRGDAQDRNRGDWQDRNRHSGDADGRSATIQITFGSRPRWSQVPGTRVREIRHWRNRPDYDMFCYDNTYYVYNGGRWYSSDQWNGEFSYIDFRSVPRELSRVPRDHWRNYPEEWVGQNRDQRSDRWGRHYR